MIYVPIALLASLLSAYVGAKMWVWFVVPALHLPMLTTTQFWGVMLLVNMLRFKANTAEESEGELKRKMYSSMGQGLFLTLVTWGIGALLHWMGQ